MHVVATAGHVDHGKSSLVKALTGTDPDRLAEEKARGLTIDLGFASTRIGDHTVAFVDVPGHEQLVRTMLAGIGPVPVVLLVVAADSGWMPQSQEHLDVLDALDVRAGLLIVSRADLADPGTVAADAQRRLLGTSLEGSRTVAVSARTGAGLIDLRHALGHLLARQPAPDPAVPVRLWTDRSFSVAGAGTVVTGTLPAGRVATGDVLALPGGDEVRIRGLQVLGRRVQVAEGAVRVAVNLRGVPTGRVARGDALVTPRRFVETNMVDVGWRPLRRTAHFIDADLPSRLVVHVGSAAIAARVRPLGRWTARLTLQRPLPLHQCDTLVLRDPGRRQVVASATVLDVEPTPLRRRGAARALGDDLEAMRSPLDARALVARRGVVDAGRLAQAGIPDGEVQRAVDEGSLVAVAGWLLGTTLADRLAGRLLEEVVAAHASEPMALGLSLAVARERLAVPDDRLVRALTRPPLREVAGVVVHADHNLVPGAVKEALAALYEDWRSWPYQAPDADRLRELGLGAGELAAAVRAGLLVRLADGVYLAPDAVRQATDALATLPPAFTVSDARRAWGTTRRVATPLLEFLDCQRRTRRTSQGSRIVVGDQTDRSPGVNSRSAPASTSP